MLAGMLKRTKYSRLHEDSRTTLEDSPAVLEDSPAHDPPSTLRDFIPNSPSQSHVSQQSLSTNRPSDRSPNVSHPPKRPMTFHHMCSFPQTPSALSTCALHKQCCSVVHRVVHHHIKTTTPSSQAAYCVGSSDSSELCTLLYMGSVEVTQSMRTLDFDTRKQVTREAINRLCKRLSVKTTVEIKSPKHKQLSFVLGRSNLQFSGRKVILTVSADTLKLIAASSQRIAQHSIQAISFVSGGDPDMEDYIAYVAKDFDNQRACHILECPQGRAAEVISSIGRAFESQFRQLLGHTPSLVSADPRPARRILNKCFTEESVMDPNDQDDDDDNEAVRGHHHYYNVIPGKTPPLGGIEDLRVTRDGKEQEAGNHLVASSQDVSLYENCSVTQVLPTDSEMAASKSATNTHNLIQEECWFHGRLGRKQAESLLTCSGDFLVRESSSDCGQYVLSGMDGTTVRHLLLVDPHGQVRTCDQVFLSVGHLVCFHMQNQMPIMTGSSELCLKQPILQRL
ncbi:SHC-transforming protein 1-like isoform X2 [Nerophis lumbriciformis]|uniref:SHC-transforming protein 1-like isoform X2 n=1 Tax=Nerophis lumbriciformis TaxID=546530 RepID=UPI002ADF02E4|nr:SHC-transforming protein 4-like isoform X2 [Nerophis lumbriciformis]